MLNPLIHMRRLTIALMISGALNVILFSLLFYWSMRELPPTSYCTLKPAQVHEQQTPLATDYSNSELVRYFRKMPLELILGRLNNTQLVENGYTQRDLALAILVGLHNFDLQRALSGLPLPEQKRTIVYGKLRDGQPAELTLYPGLTDKHFAQIQAFAATEKWPLTSKGLLIALRKQSKEHVDSSLADAFFMTPEFLAVEMLFNRADVSVEKTEILQMLLEGEWTLLSEFFEQQKATQDLSEARRQQFLLNYVKAKSPTAAFLILKTDRQFATHKLDDANAVLLLENFAEKTPATEQFARALLTSPRSDMVWKMAVKRLYEYSGEVEPEKFQYQAALSKFAPQQTIITSTLPLSAPVANPKSPMPQVKPAAKATPQAANAPIQPKKAVLAKPLAPNKPAIAKSSAAPLKLTPRKPVLTPARKPDKLYVVQEGDTLWKISRKFNVDVVALRSFNKLESEALRPGSALKIPQK